jgi:sugar phosphate isomerase/epimerase
MDARPLDLIEAARDAGCDGVGLRLHPSPNLPYYPVVGDPALIQQMKRSLEDAELSVLDIYTFYLEPQTRLDDFMPALALGAELGAGYALIQGADSDGPRLLENFVGFCKRARQFGLTASLEFVPQRDLATLAQALTLITESAQPNAAICVDPLHLARSGGTPADLHDIDLRLLPYLQFSDGMLAPGEPDLTLAKRIGVGERRLPGRGMLPLVEFLEVMPDNVPLSVEVPRPPGASMTDAAWVRTVIAETRRFIGAQRRTKAG